MASNQKEYCHIYQSYAESTYQSFSMHYYACTVGKDDSHLLQKIQNRQFNYDWCIQLPCDKDYTYSLLCDGISKCIRQCSSSHFPEPNSNFRSSILQFLDSQIRTRCPISSLGFCPLEFCMKLKSRMDNRYYISALCSIVRID